MMMRVFRRVDEKLGAIVEVWEKDDCLPCPCNNRGNCTRCVAGCLPPKNISPLRWKHLVIKLPVEIDEIHAGDYQYFSHGTYNLVYQSRDQRWILKFPISQSDDTDLPERAVRVWNTINPGCPAQVIYNSQRTPVAWVAPFIRGVQPAPSEIAQKILEIYERTGRIVADAFVTSNFIKTADGNIVCIDIGAAFFLESRPGLERIHSQVSLDTWNGDAANMSMSNIYRAEFTKVQPHSRIIVDVEKALLYLQMLRPDFRSVSGMLRQGSLIPLLALNYDGNSRRPDQILASLDAYIASCVHANVQSASAAVAINSSSDDDDDDGFCVEVSSSTESDADAQDQDEQPVVVSGNMSLGQAIQSSNVVQALPTAWLGQYPGPQYDPRLFSFPTVVQEQTRVVLPRIDDI